MVLAIIAAIGEIVSLFWNITFVSTLSVRYQYVYGGTSSIIIRVYAFSIFTIIWNAITFGLLIASTVTAGRLSCCASPQPVHTTQVVMMQPGQPTMMVPTGQPGMMVPT